MKKLLLLFILLSLRAITFAQAKNDSTNLIRQPNDIAAVLAALYHANPDSAKNTCWTGCVFIRFNVGNDRQLKNISYTTTTPRFIKEALSDAFSKINSRGTTLPLKIDVNATYLLPFILMNNNGCGLEAAWDFVKHSEKEKVIFENRQLRYDQGIKSLSNILFFDDGKKDLLNCILLSPVNVGFTMY